MTERELLADCLRRLNGIGLPYMRTGSMASNFWGIPRTTHDFDFVLSLEENRVTAIVSAFEDDYASMPLPCAQRPLKSSGVRASAPIQDPISARNTA